MEISDINLIIIIIFVLIIYIIYIIFKNKKIENFDSGYENQKIKFLSKDEIYDLFKEDKDNYFSSFTIHDWEVRNVYDKEQYLNKIKDSIKELTKEQKERLIKLTKKVDEELKKIKLSWFNGLNASNINWKIGYTYGKNYEDGLPHTRNDVVILGENTLKQTDKNLITTLVHEKVHLYQKFYPDDVEKYKEEKGYRRLRRRDENDRIRANPDIDNYIYIDKNGKELKTVYNEKAKGLEDTTTYPNEHQSSEHPNEAMAIEIEKMI